ncbi:MAG: DNA polymerase III subunit delta' [Bacteroidota bacterium]|nr:DNA polymerase III subunit delta' [Bacteroidota bacterium]
MLFKDIVGQAEAKDRLVKMVNAQRLPHALLFSGKDGCGHLLAAITLAQYLFCKNKTNNEPCGTCPACGKVSKLIHPDLHFVFPIIKSKHVKTSNDLIVDFREAFSRNNYLTINDWVEELNGENKQPIIPVEESADILKKLSYTSFEGSYKIMIIWQADRMNSEAANKLLKVLEEPTDDTIFILIANDTERLMATILSRVQHIPFYAVEEKEIAKNLMDRLGVNETAALQAAFLSEGNFREALAALHKDDEGLSFLSHFQKFMRLAVKFDSDKALLWVEENAGNGREKQKQFITYSLAVFRDALMYNFGERSLVRLSGTEKQFLEKFAPFINQKNYQLLIEEFNSNFYYIERNANPKILFMDLLLKTTEYINLK